MPLAFRRPRRLPVFFLLDTSEYLAGTLEVTMQQGLLMVRNELYRHPGCAQSVYLSSITFGESHVSQPLMSLNVFTQPTWQAKGKSALKPALHSLVEALEYDLIVKTAERPGDYAPLVFLVLGGRPIDAWQDACASLQAFAGNQRPLIIVLVTQPSMAQEVKSLSQHVLCLNPAEGVCMTNFFLWVTEAIRGICEDSEHGATSINLPELPYGVVASS